MGVSSRIVIAVVVWRCLIPVKRGSNRYYKKSLYFIDVSQSVEHEHPLASHFLRMDCHNVTEFFSKQGVPTISKKKTYEFVTHSSLKDDQVDEYLEKVRLLQLLWCLVLCVCVSNGELSN